MRNKKGNAIVIGVIVAIVVLILSAPITSYFNKPKIVVVAHMSSSSSCQPTISFYSEEASFNLKYKNAGGSHGIFHSQISSGDVLSKYGDSLEEFSVTSEKSWLVEKESSQSFNYILKIPSSEYSETIKINKEISCSFDAVYLKNIDCGRYSSCCIYHQITSTQYGLNSTEC